MNAPLVVSALARLLYFQADGGALSVPVAPLPASPPAPLPAQPPPAQSAAAQSAPTPPIATICEQLGFPGGPLELVAETASYRVSYGILGEVAQATVTFSPKVSAGSSQADGAGTMIHAVGRGQGAVLGFGNTDKLIESDFDSRTLASTRWISTRTTGDETVVDATQQDKPGVVSNLRKRAGQPDLAETFTRAAVVLDPLGFLLRLRLAPPKVATTFELLDGRALWIMTLSPARPSGEFPGTLQFEGRAEPIYWSGNPDNGRAARDFTLYLTDDLYHRPVGLVVPFGLGEARADLSGLSRPAIKPRYRLWRGIFLALAPRCGAAGGPK